MKTFKRMILIALLVSIGARFYFSFILDGFIISFSVIVLLIALYIYDEINPILLSMSVAIMSPGMRFIIDFLITEDSKTTFLNVYPDIFFYMSFGIIFYVVKKFLAESYYNNFYLVAFSSDFLSNIIELSVRTKIISLSYDMVQGLFLVAVSRTFFIVFIIYLGKQYKSMLQQEEHEERYKYLLLQSARFKSEIYFLNKNKDQIERIMKLSHQIYQSIEPKTPLKEVTLELTKDIHEVKKDYIRVIQGLEELYSEDLGLEEMQLKDILSILVESTEEIMKLHDVQGYVSYKCKIDVKLKKHYYVMSILRNLMNNCIEAFDKKSGHINIISSEDDKYLIIHFEDNGPGIDEDDLDFVFNPGYSTKYNENTGDVYRGLGLALVKDMIEREFNGSIDIIKHVDGTTFELKLLKEAL